MHGHSYVSHFVVLLNLIFGIVPPNHPKRFQPPIATEAETSSIISATAAMVMNIFDRNFDILNHLKPADPEELTVDECQQCGTPWKPSSRYSKDMGYCAIVLSSCGHTLCLDCLQLSVNPKNMRCPVCTTRIPGGIRDSERTHDSHGVEGVEVIDLVTDSSDELSSAPESPLERYSGEAGGLAGQKQDHTRSAVVGKAPPRPLAELFTDSDDAEDDGEKMADEDWNTKAFRAKVGHKAPRSANAQKSLKAPALAHIHPKASLKVSAWFKEPIADILETEEDMWAALAFLAEIAPGSTLEDLRGAITLMDLRYGTHTSVREYVESMKSGMVGTGER